MKFNNFYSKDDYSSKYQEELSPSELDEIPCTKNIHISFLTNLEVFMPTGGGLLGADIDTIIAEKESDLFLFSEDFTKVRSADSKISSWTGVSFLVGTALGAVWGSGEGVIVSKRTSNRIFINTLLNSAGRRAALLGNYGGVSFNIVLSLFTCQQILALMVSLNEVVLENITGRRGNINTFASAVITGVLFKATAGARAMALAGSIGGLAYGLSYALSKYAGYSRVVPF